MHNRVSGAGERAHGAAAMSLMPVRNLFVFNARRVDRNTGTEEIPAFSPAPQLPFI